MFYRDETRLLETPALYAADGLHKGERRLSAQKPNMIEPLQAALRSIGVDKNREINKSALEIRTEKWNDRTRITPFRS